MPQACLKHTANTPKARLHSAASCEHVLAQLVPDVTSHTLHVLYAHLHTCTAQPQHTVNFNHVHSLVYA